MENQIAQEFGACSTNSAGGLHLVQTKTKDNGYNGMGNGKWEMLSGSNGMLIYYQNEACSSISRCYFTRSICLIFWLSIKVLRILSRSSRGSPILVELSSESIAFNFQ
jgi:hypothetical protein